MKKADILNHPVVAALNPAGTQFIKARRLSAALNPFLVSHEFEVYALVAFGTFPHIKSVAALGMMLEDFKNGVYQDKHTIVVPSSGNTAHAVIRLAPAFGLRRVVVVVASDVPESKKGILSALSSTIDLEVLEVGRGQSADKRAAEEAVKEGYVLLDQYKHLGNLRAHERYTGPGVLHHMNKQLAFVAIAMGSGGTAAGVGSFLKQERPSAQVLGVRPKLGERVPGTRDAARMAEVVTIPWQEVIGTVVEVGRRKSFEAMRRLWTEVEPQPGPSSGLAYEGLLEHLRSLGGKELEALRGKRAAFLCPDDGRFYSERIGGELDPDQGAL